MLQLYKNQGFSFNSSDGSVSIRPICLSIGMSTIWLIMCINHTCKNIIAPNEIDLFGIPLIRIKNSCLFYQKLCHCIMKMVNWLFIQRHVGTSQIRGMRLKLRDMRYNILMANLETFCEFFSGFIR